jgi:tetratricopeptide (TPR) repeat protein
MHTDVCRSEMTDGGSLPHFHPMPAALPQLRAAAREAVERAEADLKAGLAETAQAQAQQALEITRPCGDEHLQGRALLVLAISCFTLGEHVSRTHLAATEAYALLGASDDLPRQLKALNIRSIVECGSGNIAHGIELLQEGLALAVGAACRSIRVNLLNNLAKCLAESGDLAEALRCVTEAVAIVQEDRADPEKLAEMRSRLATLHGAIGEDLEKLGQHSEAATHREAAVRLLPELDETRLHTAALRTYMLLTLRTQVLGSVAQWPAARKAAAALLRLSRRPGIGAKARHEALETMAEFHHRRGLPSLALRYEQRYMRWILTLGYPGLATHRLDRIAGLHARLEQWEPALGCRKELARLELQERSADAILRSRLAANERAQARARREALQQRAHTQRLAVIGRLISQTHHALHGRVTQVQQLCLQALQSPNQPGLRSRIEQVNEAVDNAAGLVSQLKLFCYRSIPEPTELLLHDALLSASQGLAQYPHPPDAQIDIGSPVPAHVWADGQRLGILLKVLLIEVTQRQGFPLMQVHIQADSPDTVMLQITADTPAAAPFDTCSIGMTLCAEMASEMNGCLQTEEQAAGMHVSLQLPRRRPGELRPADTSR